MCQHIILDSNRFKDNLWSIIKWKSYYIINNNLIFMNREVSGIKRDKTRIEQDRCYCFYKIRNIV